jgi:hypothetical protein
VIAVMRPVDDRRNGLLTTRCRRDDSDGLRLSSNVCARHRTERAEVLAPDKSGTEGKEKGKGVVARFLPIPIMPEKVLANTNFCTL